MRRFVMLISIVMATFVIASEPFGKPELSTAGFATPLVKRLTKQKETEELDFTVLDEVPAKGPAPEVIGEPLKWVVNNIDRWRGWSLTGYSWGGLSEDLNPWRVKLGVINGDIDTLRKHDYDMDRDWKDFADWETQMERDPILGIAITITF